MTWAAADLQALTSRVTELEQTLTSILEAGECEDEPDEDQMIDMLEKIHRLAKVGLSASVSERPRYEAISGKTVTERVAEIRAQQAGVMEDLAAALCAREAHQPEDRNLKNNGESTMKNDKTITEVQQALLNKISVKAEASDDAVELLNLSHALATLASLPIEVAKLKGGVK